MKLSENVVKDLLPVYLAGEASADTVSLVEEFLARNPEWRALVEGPPTAGLPGVEVPANLERRSLELTRRLLARKNWLLGGAIFFTFLPMSFPVTGSRQYFLFREAPMAAAFALAVALGLWAGFLDTCRRLNYTGLQARRSWGVRIGWALMGCLVATMGVLVMESLGAGLWTYWRPVRSFVPIAAGLLSVWLGERLNQVATIDDLHQPVSLLKKPR